MQPYFPDIVHAAITARITALTPTDGYSSSTASGYAHDANDAWTASDQALVPEYAPNPATHLSFFVDDRNLESLDGETEDHEVLVAAPVIIRYLYQIRPYDQVRDWRGSSRAAQALLAWLMVDGWSGEFNVLPASGPLLNRTPVGDGEWLACELRLRVLYSLSTAI